MGKSSTSTYGRGQRELEPRCSKYFCYVQCFLVVHHAIMCFLSAQDNPEPDYMRSRFLGAALMMLSTLSNNSAASAADDTTAFFNL